MRRSHRALVYGLTVAFVVASAVGGYRLVRSKERPLIESRIAQRVDLTQSKARQVAAWFKTAKADAGALGRRVGPFTFSPRSQQQARAALDEAVDLTVFDGGAFIVDVNGGVVSSSSTNAALVGLTRRGPEVVRALGGIASVSPSAIDSIHKRTVVRVAAPLADAAGDIRHAVVGITFLDSGTLLQTVQDLPPTLGVQTLVVDSDGTLLNTETIFGTLQKAGPDAKIPFDRSKSGESGFLVFEGEGTVDKAGSYARISDGWTLTIIQSAKSFFRPTEGPTRNASAVGALLLVLFAAGVPVMYERAVRADARAESAKKSFLAVAGHELRTPLTVIRGFGQTLLKRWDKISEAQRKDMLQTIARQARSLEYLVERLMVASQLDAGVVAPPTMRSIDLGTLLGGVAEHQQSLSAIHGVRVDVPDGLSVKADPKFLEQALTIVVENAIKFSPAGGQVLITGRPRSSEVSISVEDEGVGLPSDISSIFERFSQSENVQTRTHEEGGVGLGLFIARAQIERMGGTIRAKRRKPSGSTFEIRLPAE